MLRQPRYAALSVLMVIVAAACVSAGTWQIARLHGKASANAQLRRNAHAAPAPVADVLPLAGAPGGPPRAHRVQFRTVQATGRYDAAHQGVVRQRIVGDSTGFLVLTPLRTTAGTLLVVRGFLPDSGGTLASPTVPAPPVGPVTVLARVQPGEARHDQAGQLRNGQLESINPGDQAAGLGIAVFAGYAQLLRDQPGTAGLTAIPGPDLSNPAGGAIEPQHVAYIIQWYLFALLALAAPIAMVRAETRHRDDRDFDEALPGEGPAVPLVSPTAEQDRATRLADRYGRPVRR